MSEPFVIPLELKIIPGGQTTQDRIVLTTSGEIVVDLYDQDIASGFREIIKRSCETYAKVLLKHGDKIARFS